MTQPLRVGIVGCGIIAPEHVRAYHETGAKVVSVFDVNEASARKLAATCGAEVAPSIEAMAGSGRLDAVSVCTPAMFHLPTCQPFLDAKIPLLCEKPLEGNLPRAEELAAAVRRSGTLFMVAFCHRFHPAVVELRKLIDAGTLGEPVLLRNNFGVYQNVAGVSYGDPRLAGSGAMSSNGIHSIDLFRHLVGEPVRVQAMGGSVLQDVPVEDLGVILLADERGRMGEITSSFSLHFAPFTLEWYGSRGAATITYFQPCVPDLRYRVLGDKEWTAADCSALPDRFMAQTLHFFDCLRRGVAPLAGVEDGLIAQRVLDLAYRSIRDGGLPVPAPQRAA